MQILVAQRLEVILNQDHHASTLFVTWFFNFVLHVANWKEIKHGLYVWEIRTCQYVFFTLAEFVNTINKTRQWLVLGKKSRISNSYYMLTPR